MSEARTVKDGIAVSERPGTDPAVVMMHGFPDDSRIYGRIIPLLPNRAIAFDWLGYGLSDRPDPADLNHKRQLSQVLDALDVDRAVLVGHDASGPDAIEFTLEQPERVEHLVLLNTYYGHTPSLRFPEMIRLMADDQLTALADALLDDANQRLWLLQFTAQRLGTDPGDPESLGVTSILPQFFGDDQQSDALLVIRSWTAALLPSMDAHDRNAERLAALETPVSLIFGARDEYLTPGVASHIALRFAHAEVRPVDDASHWPQWDDPATTADLIVAAL